MNSSPPPASRDQPVVMSPSHPRAPGSRRSAPRAGPGPRRNRPARRAAARRRPRPGSRTSSSVCEQIAKSNWPSANGHGSRSQMSRWTQVLGPEALLRAVAVPAELAAGLVGREIEDPVRPRERPRRPADVEHERVVGQPGGDPRRRWRAARVRSEPGPRRGRPRPPRPRRRAGQGARSSAQASRSGTPCGAAGVGRADSGSSRRAQPAGGAAEVPQRLGEVLRRPDVDRRADRDGLKARRPRPSPPACRG